MQSYLPLIQAMLSEWYLFTLNNALYAGALASAVWLLTAILYSIRIASIKSSKAAIEKAGIARLNAEQKQLKISQEDLAEAVLQMEQAHANSQIKTQQFLTLEQLIYQRNKQIADIIQTLATSFDLGERPLLASEDVKADLLWQQHAKVISQLIERLRTEQQAKIELQKTCQAETVKLAEKERLFEALQSTLTTHTQQLSKLEQMLEAQKSILQQQDNAQQVLSDSLKHYQPDVISPTVQEQPVIVVEASPLTTVDVLIAHTDTFSSEEPQIPDILPYEAKSYDIAPELSETTDYVEQQPVIPTKKTLGKIQNLFGKKPVPVKTEPQWTDIKLVEDVQPLLADTQQPPEDKLPKAPGKLKGFYSKFKSKV